MEETCFASAKKIADATAKQVSSTIKISDAPAKQVSSAGSTEK